VSRRRPSPGPAALLTGLTLGLLVPGPAADATAGALGATAPPPPATTGGTPGGVTGRPGPVVLVGIDGAAWAAVDVAVGSSAAGPVGSGPAGPLSDLATRGSVASLTARSGDPTTCPVDGWLTVSAGRRAVGPARGPGQACPAVPGVVVDPTSVPVVPDGLSGQPDPRAAGRVTGWAALREANARSPFAAAVGTLSDAVSGARSCVTAVGPGAALAAAGPNGDVDSYVADPRRVTRDVLTGCAVTIVDAGSSVAAAAPVLARVASLLPAGSTLLVAGIDDAAVGAVGTPGLRVAAATGPRFPGGSGAALGPGGAGGAAGSGGAAGRLTTTSTRWPGMVQLTDIAPTVLTAAGVTGRPATLVGSTWTATSARSPVVTVAGLQTDAVRARVAQEAGPVLATATGTATGLLVLVSLALARRTAADSWSGLLRWSGLTVAALPLSTRLASLVPWWSAERPGVALAGAVTGWALAVAGLSLLVGWSAGRGRRWPSGTTDRWRRAALTVASLTVTVTAFDLAVGSPLQKLTVVGLLPEQDGRFHGMGNELFAATGTCALVCVAGLATRWPAHAVGSCAAVGVGVVALDGSPGLGADVRGVPAAVVGFGLAALLLALVPGTAPVRLLSGWPQLRAVLLGAVGFGVVGGLTADSGIGVPVIVAEVGTALLIACLPVRPEAPGAPVARRSDERGPDERAPAPPPDEWEPV